MREVIGEERQVRPPPAGQAITPAGRLHRHEDEHGEIERPNPEAAPDYEALRVDDAALLHLAPELLPDEVSAQHEKQIDADPAVGDERQPGKDVRGAAELQVGSGAEVERHDQEDRARPQEVEGSDLSLRGTAQVPQRLDGETD